MSAEGLLAAGDSLVDALAPLRFAEPVHTVYQPLAYARPVYAEYCRRYLDAPRRVLFLGMNPGPFGMVQTGVPFGEVAAVRDWLGLSGTITAPATVHPKRPVLGFACTRSEVSGRRLWGLFAKRFATPQAFFAGHAVMNFCPLAFVDAGGANVIPEKLAKAERIAIDAACEVHLREVIAELGSTILVGVGQFAAERLQRIAAGRQVAAIPHPSPANPAANRDWDGAATAALIASGVWE